MSFKMRSYKTFLLLISFYVFSVSGKSIEERDAEITPLEELIRAELESYANLQEQLEKVKANLNVTVVFSYTKVDDEGNLKERNRIAFDPLVGKYDPSGLSVLDIVDEKIAQEVFSFAKEVDASGMLSKENFQNDGSLYSFEAFAEDTHILYENGDSKVVLTCTEGDGEDDALENYINVLKEYEQPVDVTKELYNKDGENIKTDTSKFTPKKVKIQRAENMPELMQMKIAETLKRTFVIKDSNKDRMALVCRYLGIEFYDYSWYAIMGEGNHFYNSDVMVELVLDGDTYTIFGVS